MISAINLPKYSFQSWKENKNMQCYFSLVFPLRTELKELLVIASSQNPREFIQRRGRILRKSSNKRFAYLYDAIVVPNAFSEADKVDRIVETELSRAIQFGEWSQDKTCIVDLKLIAIDNDIDYKELQKYGTENDE